LDLCNLNALEELSRDFGFVTSRESDGVLKVLLAEGVVLVFQNLPNEQETLIGFDGTPWHTHGGVTLMLDKEHYLELDGGELLLAIHEGDVVIVEQLINGALEDRWVSHKAEPADIKYIQPGEELRFRRLS